MCRVYSTAHYEETGMRVKGQDAVQGGKFLRQSFQTKTRQQRPFHPTVFFYNIVSDVKS